MHARTKAPPRLVRTRWDMGALSPEAAAEFTRMSESRIWELMKAGVLTYGHEPHTRTRLIPVSSLVAYLDANVEVTAGTY
jgi:predicted DNA-binding transcriptional regulator AlpA